MTVQGLSWVRGHGTGNDFVILPDPPTPLDEALIRALCDRHTGLGGDGLIGVVRDPDNSGRWFMDYRNADGGLAEMCGNGIRVFVAHLVAAGLIELPDGASVQIGTRAGVKTVRRAGTDFAVDVGSWQLERADIATESGTDRLVRIPGEDVVLAGLSVNVGNPHVVCVLPDVKVLTGLDLTKAPKFDPDPPEGSNVEFIVPGHGVEHQADALGSTQGHAVGHLAMRVYERGVGETRSCGTGVVAAAIAARYWAGEQAPDEWIVDVPGGRLVVRFHGSALTAGEHAELIGPAELIAQGHLLHDPV